MVSVILWKWLILRVNISRCIEDYASDSVDVYEVLIFRFDQNDMTISLLELYEWGNRTSIISHRLGG